MLLPVLHVKCKSTAFSTPKSSIIKTGSFFCKFFVLKLNRNNMYSVICKNILKKIPFIFNCWLFITEQNLSYLTYLAFAFHIFMFYAGSSYSTYYWLWFFQAQSHLLFDIFDASFLHPKFWILSWCYSLLHSGNCGSVLGF